MATAVGGRDLAWAALLLLVLATSTLTTVVPTGQSHPGWAGGGMVIAVLITLPRRRWWPYLVAGAAADVLWYAQASTTTTSTLIRVGIDIGVCATAALILRRFGAARVTSVRAVLVLIGVGVAAGGVRVAAMWLAEAADPDAMDGGSDPAIVVFRGTAIGVLVMTPFVLAAVDFVHTRRIRRASMEHLGRVLAIAGVIAASLALTASDLTSSLEYRTFLVLPAMACAALVLRRRELAVLLAAEVYVVLGFTMRHSGFTDESAATEAIAINQAQVLSGVSAVLVWLLFSTRAEGSQARAALSGLLNQSSAIASVHAVSSTDATADLRGAPVVEMSSTHSRAVFDFLEIDPAEADSSTGEEFVDTDDLDEDLRLNDALLSGDLMDYTFLKRFRLRGGRLKWGVLTTTRQYDEISETTLITQSVTDVTAEHDTRVELERQASFDSVTGMLSRLAIVRELGRQLDSARLTGHSVGCVLVDVGPFMVLNRTLGYEAADETLALLARRVASSVSPGVAVGRFDGGILAVVVPQASGESLLAECQAILAALVPDLNIRGHRIARPPAVGAKLSSLTTTAVSALRSADAALVEARTRPDHLMIRSEVTSGGEASELETESDLRKALEQGELVAFYQPQIRLTDGGIFGYEALVRWHHPTRGLLAPGAFMPLAERIGLAPAVGLRMMQQVCAALQREPGLPGHVAVNVSPLDLADPAWRSGVEGILHATGVDPRRLVLELTETVQLTAGDEVRALLEHMRSLGMGVHLDDFGTGFSSISLLRSLPLTGLKLDRSFVADITHPGSPSLTLAAGLAGLAAGLGLTSIAEGVETADQARMLSDCGWEVGQGYLYSRPVPAPPLTH